MDDNSSTFITKAKQTHGDLFDYSRIEYVNTETPIIINCKIHGYFSIKPKHHLTGTGCPKCGALLATYKRNIATRERGFKNIQMSAGSNLLSSYDDYLNIYSVLLFKCDSCEIKFYKSAQLYKKTDNNKKCPCCQTRLSVGDDNTLQKFINRCVDKHGLYYDYSALPTSFKATDKIPIICPKHGIFYQIADVHSNAGSGCPRCKVDRVTNVTRSNTVDFIFKSNNIYNFKYNYNKVEYTNAISPVIISCPKHGDFLQTPDVHLRGGGCPKCTTTKPITKIINMLMRYKIPHSVEKTFDGCISDKGRKLRFDIYLPTFNLCVEYDGECHYTPIYSKSIDGYEAFLNSQKRDNIKNKFCEDNNIGLVRIPYTYNNPDTILYKILFNDEIGRAHV